MLRKITSMKKLLTTLDNHFRKGYGVYSACNIMRDTDLNWNKYFDINCNDMKRKVLHVNDMYELISISLPPGCKSNNHCHSKNGCIFKIIKGPLHETFTTIYGQTINNILESNSIQYIDSTVGTHSIHNNVEHNTLSLHLYSPPLSSNTPQYDCTESQKFYKSVEEYYSKNYYYLDKHQIYCDGISQTG